MAIITIDTDKLSKPDANKTKVIMAKANIPYKKLLHKFIEFHGNKYQEQDEYRIKRTFLLRQVDLEVLEDLILWSKTFN